MATLVPKKNGGSETKRRLVGSDADAPQYCRIYGERDNCAQKPSEVCQKMRKGFNLDPDWHG